MNQRYREYIRDYRLYKKDTENIEDILRIYNRYTEQIRDTGNSLEIQKVIRDTEDILKIQIHRVHQRYRGSLEVPRKYKRYREYIRDTQNILEIQRIYQGYRE